MRDSNILRIARSLSEDTDDILEKEKDYRDALRRSEQGKDSPANNTVIGTFQCLTLADWNSGIPRLRICNDPILRKLATAASDGDKPAALVSAADAWWEYSDGLKGMRLRTAKRFAASMYSKALPSLDGAEEDRVAERLKEARAACSIQRIVPVKPAVKPFPTRKKQPVREFTSFGSFVVNAEQIQEFVDESDDEQARKKAQIQKYINDHGGKYSATEARAMVAAFEYISQKNVLIARRKSAAAAKEGEVFKAVSGDPIIRWYPPAPPPPPDAANSSVPVQTVQILDDQSAIVWLFKEQVIIRGIDARSMSRGKWQCAYLFQRVADTRVPGVVGEKKIITLQAVSREGFADDIAIW
ncbi:hypothetical protein Pla175_00380 [Pirellulimonas nuda]|uniref:Uncharacterized protein n=1 Tax=Pirellulimonas nuda TaxID=2528009 RepID=A0A518D5E2_9BACT|nr:hypothetical protein [Pirellulimonas nuda]QDU86688.1 hypothetical protein Pla175_00380 [Pirellulimonas nuda]